MRSELRGRRVLGCVVLIAAAMLSGCGYALAGRGSYLPTYIHRIGLPQFANETSIIDVDRRITDHVRAELAGRGKYTIVPDTAGVDALLSGDIVAVTLTPAAFDNQNQATRYALTLTAKVEFKDMKTNKVIWSNPSMQYREEFDVTTANSVADVQAFLGQDVNALERVATEFARALVSAILEAF